jgi:hypothetical protein
MLQVLFSHPHKKFIFESLTVEIDSAIAAQTVKQDDLDSMTHAVPVLASVSDEKIWSIGNLTRAITHPG